MKFKVTIALALFLASILISTFNITSTETDPRMIKVPEIHSTIQRMRIITAGYITVNVSEAKNMIESIPDLVILDVRTQAEYETGYIKGAVLIPVAELEGRLNELDKERQTLVYCKSGRRSATASEILVENGFQKVYNMEGGILAWMDAGYPIVLPPSVGGFIVLVNKPELLTPYIGVAAVSIFPIVMTIIFIRRKRKNK